MASPHARAQGHPGATARFVEGEKRPGAGQPFHNSHRVSAERAPAVGPSSPHPPRTRLCQARDAGLTPGRRVCTARAGGGGHPLRGTAHGGLPTGFQGGRPLPQTSLQNKGDFNGEAT